MTISKMCGLPNIEKILILLIYCHFGLSRIHKLEVLDDSRKYISLSSFGYYKGGSLNVKLSNFSSKPNFENGLFGFSLDSTLSDAINSYLNNNQEKCIIKEPIENNAIGGAVYLIMNFKDKVLSVINNGNVEISSNSNSSGVLQNSKKKNGKMPMKFNLPMNVSEKSASTQFIMTVPTVEAEGLYILHFYNCPGPAHSLPNKLSFTVDIVEKNGENYLSGGEMPLPALYFMMATCFFLSGCFWVYLLAKSKNPVFKIHYLMSILVFLKSLSLLFHGINFHYIQLEGQHVAAWAILYYITHLLKGSVLFIVIVLVGTGWNFIKHILSEKDKKIFMVVIPLQVLANVAKIILEESEEGDAGHRTWWDIYILVDLICCGAIMFPVVWSIRHLQEASHTDGKAAINLRKLRLFRHFYVMIVCYIYFIYSIVYLLKITVPFQFEWLDELFREFATFIFFVLTGYKFRPAAANPYFQVPSEEENDETDIVITETGLTEGLKKINRIETNNVSATEDEKGALISAREGSHEFD